MDAQTLRARLQSAFADLKDEHDVERFLDAVRENQHLTEKRFVSLAWLLLVLVLLFELLIGGTVREGLSLFGVSVPPQTVRDALPAAIAAVYLGLVVIGQIRMRQRLVHDLALEEYRPQLSKRGLHLYLSPASLLQGRVLLDGADPESQSRLIKIGPVANTLVMLVGPPVYVVVAVVRCLGEPHEALGLLLVSAILALVFCLYGVLVFFASHVRKAPAKKRT